MNHTNPQPDRPRIGSLFSGYGGLDLAAVELFSATVAWHVEYDTAPSKILAHHWPTVPNYGDVTTVDWTTVEPVDILTGGYPCQPFSAAGKRKGTNDERHLWPYVRDAIRRIRPRYVLLENVAGHRSLGFDRVLGDMAEDGLNVRWTSVRASEVGAPHHRERLFILATPADTAGIRPGECFQSFVGGFPSSIGGSRADATESCGTMPTDSDGFGCGQGQEQPGAGSQEVTATVGNLGALSGDGRADDVLVLPTPMAQHSGNTPENHLRKKPGRNRVTDLAILVVNGLLETGGVPVLPTPAASDGTGGGQHPDKRVGHTAQLIDHALEAGTPAWGKYAPAIHRWERRTRPAPAPTEPNSNNKPRLAAAFAEWMMGLPEGHVTNPAFSISREAQLKALGNGVCPQQAYAAGCELLAMALPVTNVSTGRA